MNTITTLVPRRADGSIRLNNGWLVSWLLTFPDTLPPDLNLQLRANRYDTLLPDSHCDKWMLLTLAHAQDNALFDGTKTEIQHRIRHLLRLGPRDSFPAARVVTLWRNNRWRDMLTRWCETEIGRSMLTKLSTLEWMASLHIDSVSGRRGKRCLRTLIQSTHTVLAL